MNVDFCVTQLGHNAGRILDLVQHVSQEQASWKPDPGTWSILEVINHLYDEERLDFRARLDSLLHEAGLQVLEVWVSRDRRPDRASSWWVNGLAQRP